MILEGQISLFINMEGKEVMVTFIVVALFSPYMAILGRPGIHAMGAVPSTLHVKVKFRTEQGITIVRGASKWLGSAWWPLLTGRSNKRNQPMRSPYSNYRNPWREWGLTVPRT